MLVCFIKVVGVPDERLGEELCAWIELKGGETVTEATEDEIKYFCKERVMTMFTKSILTLYQSTWIHGGVVK